MDRLKYDHCTKIISSEGIDFVPSTNGIECDVFESMQKFKGRNAQIDAQTGEKDTYGDFQQRCIRVAIKMKKLGIKPGDIITICSYNHLNSTVPYISAIYIGAISANLDPTLSSDDMQHLLNIVKPKLIFATGNVVEKLQKAVKAIQHKCEIICFSDASFSDYICEQADEDTFTPMICNSNSTCSILFSSGTTGLPKGICIPHNYLKFSAMIVYSNEEIKVTLMYSTLYWISNLINLFGSILNGLCRLMCDSFNPELFWSYIRKYKVDFSFLAPSQLISALKVKPIHWTSNPLLLLIGGSRIAPTYLQTLTQIPSIRYEFALGSTECGFISRLDSRDVRVEAKIQSCGIIEPGLQIKIVDPDTEKPVGFNTAGELRVKPKYPMNGYYNKDSCDAWDSDGFIKTGDQAYYDEDFYLYHQDRLKQMFKYLSWHIVPAKLEAILEQHASVQSAVVVGIPHPEEDSHAMGIVVLKDKMHATEEELKKFVDGQVDERNRLRAGVRIIDELPMTPSGKIKGIELRDRMIHEIENRK